MFSARRQYCCGIILGYYLEKKNLHDYMGVDTYVKQCLEKDDLKWIPSRTSFALQNAGRAVASEENSNEKIVKALRDVSVGLATLGKEVGMLRDRMGVLEEKNSINKANK